MWHEGLEEASRHWFTDNNLEGMLATLEPLHEKIEAVSQVTFCKISANLIQGPSTERESSFLQTFGRDLMNAKELCRRFREYNQSRDLDEAWQTYYNVRVLKS
jgi:serine/threonine-protein kinase mTOR